MNIYSIIKVKNLFLMEWSYRFPPPPIIFTIEPRMVHKVLHLFVLEFYISYVSNLF